MNRTVDVPAVRYPVGKVFTKMGWEPLVSGDMCDLGRGALSGDDEGRERFLFMVYPEDAPLVREYGGTTSIMPLGIVESPVHTRMLSLFSNVIEKDENTAVEVSGSELHKHVTVSFHCTQAVSRNPSVAVPLIPAPAIDIPRVPQGLMEHLRRFGQGVSEQPQASQVFMPSVHELTATLCELSETPSGVSATVDSEGMLTLSAAVPGHKRVYVEIEPSGAVGAAVTKERKYAHDIPVNAIHELTREVISDSLGSL